MTIRGVVFDLDGVLINSIQLMELAYSSVTIDHYGTDHVIPTFEHFCNHMGKKLSDIFTALNLPQELVPKYQEFCLQNEHRIEPFHDVITLIKDLDAHHVPVAIFTGKDRFRTLRILERIGISQIVRYVITSDDVVCGKPHPEGICKISTALNIPTEQLVMVGDSPHDINAGKVVSTATIGVTWGFATEEELLTSKPDYIASDYRRLHEDLYTLLGIRTQVLRGQNGA
jgi:HAD superfamily hydrolase (TIGR01549 family)